MTDPIRERLDRDAAVVVAALLNHPATGEILRRRANPTTRARLDELAQPAVDRLAS